MHWPEMNLRNSKSVITKLCVYFKCDVGDLLRFEDIPEES